MEKRLRVLIASDSFKGSATSRQVGAWAAEGVRRAAPEAQVRALAIADGGEGTVEAVVSACGGAERTVEVQGPLGEAVRARYGLLPTGDAVIEMAEAVGITLVSQSDENARAASTYGVGQLIVDALDHGARRVFVGLGGSATSDGGAGMARALGARFLDAAGSPVAPGLQGLGTLARIDVSALDPRLKHAELVALTDVVNPLTGPAGAVRVYGPQKGLAEKSLARYDAWMGRYAALLARDVPGCAKAGEGRGERASQAGSAVADLPGAGAAGGLGAGLAAFCGARLQSGIEAVLDLIGIDEVLQGVDLVITGEGRMDAQSAYGKAPVGVARRAKRCGVPVAAVVGSRAADLGAVYRAGIDLVVPLPLGPATLEECMRGARELIACAAETATRAYLLGVPN